MNDPRCGHHNRFGQRCLSRIHFDTAHTYLQGGTPLYLGCRARGVVTVDGKEWQVQGKVTRIGDKTVTLRVQWAADLKIRIGLWRIPIDKVHFVAEE